MSFDPWDKSNIDGDQSIANQIIENGKKVCEEYRKATQALRQELEKSTGPYHLPAWVVYHCGDETAQHCIDQTTNDRGMVKKLYAEASANAKQILADHKETAAMLQKDSPTFIGHLAEAESWSEEEWNTELRCLLAESGKRLANQPKDVERGGDRISLPMYDQKHVQEATDALFRGIVREGMRTSPTLFGRVASSGGGPYRLSVDDQDAAE